MLNSLPVDDVTIQNKIDEANYAFALNRDVVYELEEDVKAIVGQHVFELLIRQNKPGSTEHTSSAKPVMSYNT